MVFIRKLNKVLCMSCVCASVILSQAGALSVSAMPQLVRGSNFTASSALSEGGYDYSAQNVADLELTTAWVEGVSGDGIGESFSFQVPAGTVLTRGILYLGYLKSEDLFYKNGAPTGFTISSGGVEMNFSCEGVVQDYNRASDGYEFFMRSIENGGNRTNVDLPNDGLVSDGTVTITIDSVRSGSKYADTCITELSLFTDDKLTANETTVNETAGASADNPADMSTDAADTAGQNDMMEMSAAASAGNLAEVGAASQEKAAVKVNLQDLDQEKTVQLKSFAQAIYDKCQEYGELSMVTYLNEDLDSEDKAWGLFWYQYNCNDSRISFVEEYNTASQDDLRRMMYELYGDVTDEDMEAFLDKYCVSRDGNIIYMNGTGDFGAAGEYYFSEPASVVIVGGF